MRTIAVGFAVIACACASTPPPIAPPSSPVAKASPPIEAPPPARTPDPAPPPEPDPDPAPAREPAPTPPRVYRSVLSVGDSFNGAFSVELSKRFAAENVPFARDVWVAVALTTFARSSRFAELLKKHDPDLVLINLGANDIDAPDPEREAEAVRAIVKLVGARDCYWITPALWRKERGDTSITSVIAKNAAPCRVFESKGFKVERGRDGWHPTVDGGAVWAARFWDFFKADVATR